MNTRALTIVVVALTCAASSLASAAEVPRLLHYQGTVLDNLGEPVAGRVDVEFGVWDAATDGALLYSENHTAVPLSEGVFSLLIGTGDVSTGELKADLFSSPERWLELALDGEVLAPRQRIGSVGYALVAEEAEHAEVAETLSELPPDSEVVSTAGATFTGPVSLAGPSGMNNVSLGAMPGQPEHGLVAVNNADGDQSARLSVDAMGRGEVRVNDAEGRSMVEIGSSTDGASGFEDDGTTSGTTVELSGGYFLTRGPSFNVNVWMTHVAGWPDHGFVSVANAFGQSRAGLFVDPAGRGAMQLLDFDGLPRTVADGEGVLRTIGRNGLTNTGFGRGVRDDEGIVFVADDKGLKRASLEVFQGESFMGVWGDLRQRVEASSQGRVSTFDASTGIRRTVVGEPPPDLSPSTASEAVVALANAAGQVRAIMEVGENGEAGRITTRGRTGTLNVRIGGDEDSGDLGLIEMFDGTGLERVSLGIEDDVVSQNASLNLRDPNDKLRARIDDDGAVWVYGSDGAPKAKARLGSAESSPNHGALEVHNPAGLTRAKVYVDASGQGAVQIADPEGNIRARMGVDNGAGLIETIGAGGSTNIRLTHLEANPRQGLLSVHNIAGTAVATLLADNTGSGVAQIADPDGNVAVALGVESTGQGVVITGGPMGSQNVRISSPIGSPDHGAISVLDESSRVRAIMEVIPAGAGLVGTLGPNGNDNVRLTSVVGNENHGLVSVHDAAGNALAIMVSDPSGVGRVIADIKSFIVDHPNKAGQKIVYASLEGPEAAMYYRGVAELVDGRGRIDLPEHFAVLAAPGTITAQLTPRSFESFGVAVDEIGEDHIDIAELFEGTGSYEVHFLVHAVRRGFEDYQPVRSDAEVNAMCAGTPVGPLGTAAGIDEVVAGRGT